MIDEGRKAEILKALETDLCPECGANLLYHGVHDRDSTNDYTYCPKCKWLFTEMETWRLGI